MYAQIPLYALCSSHSYFFHCLLSGCYRISCASAVCVYGRTDGRVVCCGLTRTFALIATSTPLRLVWYKSAPVKRCVNKDSNAQISVAWFGENARESGRQEGNLLVCLRVCPLRLSAYKFMCVFLLFDNSLCLHFWLGVFVSVMPLGRAVVALLTSWSFRCPVARLSAQSVGL